ncbi:MAG TPA: hypothetical protein ENG83_16100 [Nitrospirae bacterium]|nr:hypothetical protein BMS3Abin06_00333 [bacterium BMS3Abin06]HDH13693.1 hypothetical protein [Nitrospirota bacterium]HDZ00768.1 hypothetical protein [Nitrospirota bacterium]
MGKADISKTDIKIREALEILKALGLPRQQQNERSALTLLSLLNLKPNSAWKNASDAGRTQKSTVNADQRCRFGFERFLF